MPCASYESQVEMVLKAQLLIALFISPKWSVASRCKHFLADRSHWSCLFLAGVCTDIQTIRAHLSPQFCRRKGRKLPMLLFFPYFWLVGGHGSRCYIFIKQIFFCSYVLQARSLGSWSKVSPWPCWPLSVPIENPQALKTFGLCCCYCLRPYLNTVHTPTCPECNTNGSYRATWNYCFRFIYFGF